MTTSPLNRGWEGGTPTQNAILRRAIREIRPEFARAESSFATVQARFAHAEIRCVCILLIWKDLLWRRGWDSCQVTMREAHRAMPEDHPNRRRASVSE
jgi:hypothetical protein